MFTSCILYSAHVLVKGFVTWVLSRRNKLLYLIQICHGSDLLLKYIQCTYLILINTFISSVLCPRITVALERQFVPEFTILFVIKALWLHLFSMLGFIGADKPYLNGRKPELGLSWHLSCHCSFHLCKCSILNIKSLGGFFISSS